MQCAMKQRVKIQLPVVVVVGVGGDSCRMNDERPYMQTCLIYHTQLIANGVV